MISAALLVSSCRWSLKLQLSSGSRNLVDLIGGLPSASSIWLRIARRYPYIPTLQDALAQAQVWPLQRPSSIASADLTWPLGPALQRKMVKTWQHSSRSSHEV